MRILIDENMSSPRLAAVLRTAGHDVVLSTDVGPRSQSDARVMIDAIGLQRLVLTRDYEDYTDLHDLVMATGGRHPGILIVRFDDDPSRNLSFRAIFTAIGNLESAGIPIDNHVHVLNHWR
jgi:predicted nuclease of predicted toxin-antitoxin system